MRKKFILWCLSVIFTNSLLSQQFLYPIAQLDDETVLLMHQKTFDDIELLIWNPYTKIARKELTSLYIPAYVQLLPSKTAYSFLDRGRIRIKSFQRRAPKTIDIFEPICDIQSVHWITDEQCYFVAKYRDHYKIFMYDIAQGGLLYCLTGLDDAINYIFPSKIDDTLFCLIQSDHGVYQVGKLAWNPILFDLCRQQADLAKLNTLENIESSPACSSILVHDHPLCFLSMQTKESGFVLELLEKDTQLSMFKFGCCAINLDSNAHEPTGKIERLFEIALPEHLIIGYLSDRLYESIYPLLPRYSNDLVYFTSYDMHDHECRIYQYDLVTKQTEICYEPVRSFPAYQHIFAPLITGDALYAGCSFDNFDVHRSALQVNESNGIINCDIPVFALLRVTA